jgi:isoleucyl-tRNA synthetase
LPYRNVKTPVKFPELEKEILDFWEKNNIFQKSIDTRPADKRFIFYEGPPTANGKPGIHHVISRGIKDFVCRYKTMRGYRVHRKAGWDTHGLPVEIEVEKELGFQSKDQIEEYGVEKFNEKCRESVFRYLKEWNEMTRRIAFWVDMDDPYITYTNEYIESVWWLLAEMWKKDLLYLGFKILPYCPRCETALSSHEVSLGYREVTERSVTVKFPLKNEENKYILAWTTTPWTLPGNVALAVGPKVLYAEVEQERDGIKERYILAENRLDTLKGPFKIIKTFPGSEMKGWKYNPLFDFVNLEDEKHEAYYVAEADFVTTDEGTGVVHTAVMYGEDDYSLGLALGLPAKHTVDGHGHFNERVDRWQGRHVKESGLESEIVDYLQEKGRLYKEDLYTHAYPHCWRCDSPILYYAKESWYLRTTRVKEKLLENNKAIRWYPREVGEGRFGQWLENNVDWALSRDRYWGTPLNMWICGSCDKKLAVESIEQLKDLSGEKEIPDLHKPYIDKIVLKCPDCQADMVRTLEVIDCWFDSGAMPYAQFHFPFENRDLFKENFPSDFIAEGVDQTRGWFYSMLAISTIISGEPSYKSCISLELIQDKDGQKMSKSRGNVVDPFKILDSDGADPLRWYFFTVSPPWVPTRFDQEGILEVSRKFFGTLVNTYSFFVLYANIDQFMYTGRAIPVEERPEIDRWLISKRNGLVQQLFQLLERFDVTRAARSIQDFVIDDLSNWYVRRNRRRYWKSEKEEDKTAAYQTLFETLFTLSKVIAPFSPFLAEEIYRNLNTEGLEDVESVHLAIYPHPDEEAYSFRDESLEERMDLARTVVSMVRSARNEANIRVRQPLRRAIIAASPRKQQELQKSESFIMDEINVHRIEYVEDASDLLVKRAKPVFPNLGPKFGSNVGSAAEKIRQMSQEEIGYLEDGKPVRIQLQDGSQGEIHLQDIEIIQESAEGLLVQSNGEITAAIDISLDSGLIAEGLAREFVNRVQHMRKEADYEVTDRIKLYYKASPVMGDAINRKRDYIQEEVLAESLSDHFQDGDISREWTIDQETVQIGIRKV